jgi:large subunit ribosomal protein L22
MQVSATAKYVRIAPRHVQSVAGDLSGLPAEEALAALAFMPHRAAYEIAKVIKSAAANAENNYGLDRDQLVVKTVLVDQGPSLRRWRPKGRGRVNPFRRRSSHITVVVDDQAA